MNLCAGSWILTRSKCTHFRALQDKMMRRMIYLAAAAKGETIAKGYWVRHLLIEVVLGLSLREWREQ